MADLEKALRHTVNGILYCWKPSPLLSLSCYPFPLLNVDGQLITFVGHGGKVGLGQKKIKKKKKKTHPNNFEEDSGGLKDSETGIFGGSSFS